MLDYFPVCWLCLHQAGILFEKLANYPESYPKNNVKRRGFTFFSRSVEFLRCGLARLRKLADRGRRAAPPVIAHPKISPPCSIRFLITNQHVFIHRIQRGFVFTSKPIVVLMDGCILNRSDLCV